MSHQPRKRRWSLIVRVAVVLALTLVALALVLIFQSGGSRGKNHHYKSATPQWCVPISREAAIVRVMRDSAEVPATDTAKAKLVGIDYWAVAVEGSVTPAFSHGGRYAWAVFNIDAHTGDIRGLSAGAPGSTPSDWNSLPDRTSDCTAG